MQPVVDALTEEFAHRVIGAAIEVHQHPGPGFLESVYEAALCHELILRGIPFTQRHRFQVTYKGRAVGERRLDLLVGDKLIIELKAVEAFNAAHLAQAIASLKATSLQLRLLINFNVTKLKQGGIKRVIL